MMRSVEQYTLEHGGINE